jgi:predicted DNA-binding protein
MKKRRQASQAARKRRRVQTTLPSEAIERIDAVAKGFAGVRSKALKMIINAGLDAMEARALADGMDSGKARGDG